MRKSGEQIRRLYRNIDRSLEAFADPKTAALAKDGFIYLSPLQRLCIQAVKDNMDDHPFALKVKRILGTHLIRYQEVATRYSSYMCLLSDRLGTPSSMNLATNILFDHQLHDGHDRSKLSRS